MADACDCVPLAVVPVKEGTPILRARFATITKDNIGQVPALCPSSFLSLCASLNLRL
jgi:hypothetical protein